VKLVTPNASDTLNLATAYPVTTVTGTSGALTLPTFVANDVVILDLDVAANDAGGGDDSVMVTKTGNFTPQRLYLEAGTGNNSITFDSGNQSLERVNYNLGTLDVIANHTASVQLALRGAPLRSLTINDSAIVSANLGPYRLSSLSIAPNAIFDLGVEDLILDTTPATRQSVFNAVESWIASGRNGGTSRWFGKGITAYPSTSTPRIVGLASMINEGPGGSPIFTTFDGQSVNTNSILVKYTYEGDVNFNGQIDPDDYAAIDAGFATRATGYIHGDFNRSGGPPNSDDYFTIDQAFFNQGAPLSAPAAPAPAVVESTSAAAPIAATPEAPASSAIAVSTDSDSLKRTKHRHHKRAPKLDPVWSPRIPRSDALTRFLRRF
jgi:hypothetical protein